MISFNEAAYLKKHFNEVKHVTLNPNGHDVLRVHMVPPRKSFKKNVPSVIILNGQDIIPVNLSWAILLSAFIDAITPFDGREMEERDWDSIIGITVKSVKRVYPLVKESTLKDDLWTIIHTLTDIAQGKTPEADIGQVSIGAYAPHMKAPHRMDLMISSMAKDTGWNCNQKCLHCYAAGQALAVTSELPTHSWKAIIDQCRQAGIPQLTFTGGEPTLRPDLTELVAYSKWFVTRLNTNGVLLTAELCRQLYEASLDSVQVTLYDCEAQKHNALVGAENWTKTVDGIKNALHVGLNISVNTPLCTINRNYVQTLKALHALGVRFVTCSGLIVAGNAREAESVGTQLDPEALYGILKDAFAFCEENGMELNFTSPGWISDEKLHEIGFKNAPTCGACLSNMAISPDGNIVPCQSWLSDEPLGSLLHDPWEKIWDSPRCRIVRQESSRMNHTCPLRTETKVKT